MLSIKLQLATKTLKQKQLPSKELHNTTIIIIMKTITKHIIQIIGRKNTKCIFMNHELKKTRVYLRYNLFNSSSHFWWLEFQKRKDFTFEFRCFRGCFESSEFK